MRNEPALGIPARKKFQGVYKPPVFSAEPMIYKPVFSPEQMERAKIIKQEREIAANAKNTRRSAILTSVENFELQDDPPLLKDADPISRQRTNLSVEPLMTTQDRKPFVWDGAPPDEIDGEIVPSDQAYADMILDNGLTLPEGVVWADFITVESISDKFGDNMRGAFRYVNAHTIKYNGEPIWKLATEHSCNTNGTRGQSSSCILMKAKGILRVKIIHKGRNNVGSGWNSRETREYRVEDIIKKSGEARGRELSSQ